VATRRWPASNDALACDCLHGLAQRLEPRVIGGILRQPGLGVELCDNRCQPLGSIVVDIEEARVMGQQETAIPCLQVEERHLEVGEKTPLKEDRRGLLLQVSALDRRRDRAIPQQRDQHRVNRQREHDRDR
jgi:hypothetical protein